MNREAIEGAIRQELKAIAPEIDLDALDPTEDLRDAVDLDSMDALNLAVRIHQRTGVEIPDSELARLRSLADCVDFCVQRVEKDRPSPR